MVNGSDEIAVYKKCRLIKPYFFTDYVVNLLAVDPYFKVFA